MTSEVKKEYQLNLESNQKLLRRTIHLNKTISFLRLLVFIIAAVAVYIFARTGSPALLVLSVIMALIIFLALVKIHSQILIHKKLHEALHTINENEISALDGNYSCFVNGIEYSDPAHPFCTDLDVFGEGSLFQFLNRTSTQPGKDALAGMLKNPVNDSSAISALQEAIKELRNNTNWRQDFQATGMVYRDSKTEVERIIKWIELPPLFSHYLFGVLRVSVPIMTLSMIVITAIGFITGFHLILYLFFPLAVSGAFAIRVNRRHQQVSKTSEMLTKYAVLLRKIESLEMISPKLNDIKLKVKSDKLTASGSLKTLSGILTALDNRLNFVSWTLFNGFVLWDILQMHRLEKWQNLHRNEIHKWFEAIAEIDAMNSLATFSFNNPEVVFPVLSQIDDPIHAESLGHPLIHKRTRVDNPFDIRKGQFLIITGANMAGKSTYLRTVGVNLVLAMCGAPVCAKSFFFRPVNLFTSIHTSDSLYKNESYFYSELKRLQAIICELKSGRELFIILDEILKGTNSRDKHTGSEALLKQLIRYGASGIIATHDVALGELQVTFPENICNLCFEVDIHGDRLTFDYKLRKGVSKNMNATILMREMGITV